MLHFHRAAIAAGALAALTACAAPPVNPPPTDVPIMDAVSMDATTPCPMGQSFCSGRCLDTASDRRNCGACGNVCRGASICSMGRCEASCPPDQTLCNGVCVTVTSDPLHCGMCGNACPAGQVCSRGACSLVCDTALTRCSASAPADAGASEAGAPADGGASSGELCVDTQTDRRHCGMCGRACALGQACVSGTCQVVCGAGQTMCMGACADLRSDALNCGACGTACTSSQSCIMGTCRAGCPSGQNLCSGACVDLQNDPRNCGGCTRACTASQVCQAGTCVTRCPMGQSACGDRCVDTSTDATNCGMCGTRCAAGQVCEMGACATRCPMGNVLCGGRCIDTSADPANCGACGTACAAGSFCSGGACMRTCTMGSTMCGATCADLNSDNSNCGACGRVCGAMTSCVAGTCRTLAMVDGGCTPPSLQCGSVCTDPRSSNTHCGRCGNACAADRTCVNGACTTFCAAGEIRCGAMGTCTDINRDSANCGMCGRACASGESCAGGTCSPDPSFRIATMSSMGCTLSADVQSAPMPAGDQRGLLVATNNLVYYTGDTSTVVLPASDLSTITAVGAVHDTLVADLRGSAAYIMLDAMGMSPSSGTSASIVALGQLTATGSLGAFRVTLSRALRLDSAGSNNGFYSGFGRIILYIAGGADMGWWQIAMPTGLVTRLTGTMPPNGASFCESWAHSGIAEFFGGEQYVVFMRGSTGVVRQRVRDGLQTTIMANTSTGDVCTVGFSIARNRWYFQYEAAPAWAPPPGGSFGEFVGTCTATWETP